jgi:hypothetical protein
MTPHEFWLAAAECGSYITAGDPGACMYGFDERGCVQSEEHRQQCFDWIENDCRKAADANEDPAADHDQLDSMLDYPEKAPVA